MSCPAQAREVTPLHMLAPPSCLSLPPFLISSRSFESITGDLPAVGAVWFLPVFVVVVVVVVLRMRFALGFLGVSVSSKGVVSHPPHSETCKGL